jgi:hypothetical protein
MNKHCYRLTKFLQESLQLSFSVSFLSSCIHPVSNTSWRQLAWLLSVTTTKCNYCKIFLALLAAKKTVGPGDPNSILERNDGQVG